MIELEVGEIYEEASDFWDWHQERYLLTTICYSRALMLFEKFPRALIVNQLPLVVQAEISKHLSIAEDLQKTLGVELKGEKK